MSEGKGRFTPLGGRTLGDGSVTPPLPALRIPYWVEERDGPGYGVTAGSRDEAIALAEDAARRRKVPFELRGVTEGIDPATLPEGVRRWMDPPTTPGVWFPGSGKQPLTTPPGGRSGAQIAESEEAFDRGFLGAHLRWISILLISALLSYGVLRLARWPLAAGAPLAVLLALLGMAIEGTGFRRYLPVQLSRTRRIQIAAVAVIAIGALVAFFARAG